MYIIINDAARGGAGAGAGEVTQLDMSGDSDHAQSCNTQLNMKPHRASLCFHIDQTISTNPCNEPFLSKNKLILSEDKT